MFGESISNNHNQFQVKTQTTLTKISSIMNRK